MKRNEKYLGSPTEFDQEYLKAIEQGQSSDATEEEIKLMKSKLSQLKKRVNPFFLRRNKDVLSREIPPMKEFYLFVKLSDKQSIDYQLFLDQFKSKDNNQDVNKEEISKVNEDEEGEEGALNSSTDKKLKTKGKNNNNNNNVTNNSSNNDFKLKSFLVSLNSKNDLINNGKLSITMKIIVESFIMSEKVVVFTESLRTIETLKFQLSSLDYPSLLQLRRDNSSHKLNNNINNINNNNINNKKKEMEEGKEYLVMQGATKLSSRQDNIKLFQDERKKEPFLFIVSIGTGGFGINLQAGSRVVIYDHPWNPSQCDQAIARCWRLGQKKKVFVYKLISFDTFEQNKVWKLCVNKEALFGHLIAHHSNPSLSLPNSSSDQPIKNDRNNNKNENFSDENKRKEKEKAIVYSTKIKIPSDPILQNVFKANSHWIPRIFEPPFSYYDNPFFSLPSSSSLNNINNNENDNTKEEEENRNDNQLNDSEESSSILLSTSNEEIENNNNSHLNSSEEFDDLSIDNEEVDWITDDLRQRMIKKLFVNLFLIFIM